MKTYLIIFLVIVLGSIGFFIFNSKNADVEVVEIEPAETFVVLAQEIGDTVIIERAIAFNPAFIVLREVINGKPGQIVEISDYLTSGVAQNVTIDISAVELAEDSELIAVLYKDNGDMGFNPNTDTIVYEKGRPLVRFVETGEYAPASVVVAGGNTNTTGPIAVTVEYTDEGFSPKVVEISKGETVLFVNKSSVSMWVASNNHPAHTILPTFDQFGKVPFGETYQYTFDKTGEWEYHDHINARQLGTVIVR